MKTHSSLRFHLPGVRGSLLGLAFLVVASSLPAGTYDVRHNFTLRPGGNVVPQVQGVYYAHAWAQTRRPDCQDWAVVPGPGAQPVGWGPFGRDSLSSRGTVRHRDGAGPSVLATQGRVNVGAAGLARTTWTADARNCASAQAIANSEITVGAFGAGTPVRGTIRAHGWARASAPPPRFAASYAFSMAMVEARGGRQMRNGTIRWGKVVRDVVAGRTTERRQVDPIDFEVINLATGETRSGTLFTMSVDIPASPFGGIIWEDDRMEITASNLVFHAGFPSTNSSLQGELAFEVRDGRVVSARGTGHYAHQAPAVGDPVPFTLPVPNEIEFDYDLGDFGDDDLEVGLDFSGAGETNEEAASDEPHLSITLPTPDAIQIEYFLTETPYVLESSPTVTPGPRWMPVLTPPLIEEDRVIYRLPLDRTFPSEFFRLRRDGPPDDTEPPTFQAIPECGAPILMVEFSEPVAPPTALNPMHYQLMSFPPVPWEVLGVEMVSPQTVMLMLNQPLLPGGVFQLQVQGVSDLAGNVVPPGTTAVFTCGTGDN